MGSESFSFQSFSHLFDESNSIKKKEVTCYECKKPGHIRSECPKLKHKSKGAKERRKATWDDTSESEKEEEQQQETTNLCIMAFEDDNEVPSSSNSSFYEFNNNCHDIDDNDDDDYDYDDEISFVSKLMSKCKSLLSKKKHYKHKLISLTKEFENLKNEFSSLTLSNAKLVTDLKNSNSLEEQLKTVNDENHKLSSEVLELKNSISKFHKGKATLDNLLESQKSHGDTQGIGYENRTFPSPSSHINFIKSSSHSTPSSSKQNDSQTFKVERSQVSNTKTKSNKI